MQLSYFMGPIDAAFSLSLKCKVHNISMKRLRVKAQFMTGNMPRMSLLSQYWVAQGILFIPIKMHIPKKALSSGTIR